MGSSGGDSLLGTVWRSESLAQQKFNLAVHAAAILFGAVFDLVKNLRVHTEGVSLLAGWLGRRGGCSGHGLVLVVYVIPVLF